MDDSCVLVVGYRKGLIEALKRLGLPFALWSEKKQAVPATCRHREVERIGMDTERIKTLAARFKPFGPFTHVIAGTEGGVYAASVCRRVLGARMSVDSTIKRCRDKLLMKSFLAKAGIPMTDFLGAAEVEGVTQVFERLGSPVVVKERTRSGGRGIRFISREEELAGTLGRGRLLERFVEAPEFSVESFVVDGVIRFESVTEYYEKGRINIVPCGIDSTGLEEILELNRAVIESLRIKWGMTHHEIYRTSGGPIFGEIALRPPGGYIMECLREAWGFDAWDAFVAVELGRPFAFPEKPRALAAATILHPGAGKVVDIVGLDRLTAHSATVECKLKAEVGLEIGPRSGAGDDVGHILQRALDRKDLEEALDFARQTLRIELA